jgi:hypothetical protein
MMINIEMEPYIFITLKLASLNGGDPSACCNMIYEYIRRNVIKY